MTSIQEAQALQYQEETIKMLHHLGIGIHRLGYKCLTIGIPCYRTDDTQSLSKEVYPHIAHSLGYSDWHGAERAIRTVILDGWENRNPEVWEEYFPNQKKAPTNKQFLAVLAERLR